MNGAVAANAVRAILTGFDYNLFLTHAITRDYIV